MLVINNSFFNRKTEEDGERRNSDSLDYWSISIHVFAFYCWLFAVAFGIFETSSHFTSIGANQCTILQQSYLIVKLSSGRKKKNKKRRNDKHTATILYNEKSKWKSIETRIVATCGDRTFLLFFEFFFHSRIGSAGLWRCAITITIDSKYTYVRDSLVDFRPSVNAITDCLNKLGGDRSSILASKKKKHR